MEGGAPALYSGPQLVSTSDPRIPVFFVLFTSEFRITGRFVFAPNGSRAWRLGLGIIFRPSLHFPREKLGKSQADGKRIWKSAWKFDRGREERDAPTGMIIRPAAHV